MNLYIQWFPSRINTKNIQVNTCLKSKDKEKSLKSAKEKWLVTYKGNAMRLTANLETMEASAQWEKYIYMSRILYPEKLFFGLKVK